MVNVVVMLLLFLVLIIEFLNIIIVGIVLFVGSFIKVFVIVLDNNIIKRIYIKSFLEEVMYFFIVVLCIFFEIKFLEWWLWEEKKKKIWNGFCMYNDWFNI